MEPVTKRHRPAASDLVSALAAEEVGRIHRSLGLRAFWGES